MKEGAWINQDGVFEFVDEHADWIKRPGNGARLGLREDVWQCIEDIPNDYSGPSRERILKLVMAEGFVRLRGHGSYISLEFTCATNDALLACRAILRKVAGKFTLCRFNNLSTNETLELYYDEYQKRLEELVSDGSEAK